MNRFLLLAVLTTCLVSAQSQAPAQSPRVAVLDVLVENVVIYRLDTTDPTAFGTAKGPTTAAPNRSFQEFVGIGDIVSVNGKPAKGAWTNRGHTATFSPSPAPGESIANVATGNHIECSWDLYTAEGIFVGRLSDRGLSGHTFVGGGGAFLGVQGEHFAGPLGPGGFNPPQRRASVAEDPSMRRVHGGGTWQVLFYLVPAFWPEVEMTPQGPAILHEDGSLVTSSGPARAGEVLILRAKGLGPTRPNLRPAGAVRFGANPYEEVNSPVEVTVNGMAAEVINKIGWPGETDTYRVDIRLPSGIAPGPVSLQITAAWIPGSAVTVPVR
jgi:hypothetical protein